MDRPVKTFTIARRKAGVDHDDLADRWLTTHAANALEHMRPDGYTITIFDARDGRTPYDGMAELRYHDLERYRTLTGGNIPDAVAHDEWAGMVDLPNTWLRAVEHVVVAGPDGTPATRAEREAAFKLTFLITAGPGHDVGAVRRHWLDVHVPNFREHFVETGGVRYVVNLAERSAGEDLVGLAELSYRDRACAEAH